jgi:hypothetical protein
MSVKNLGRALLMTMMAVAGGCAGASSANEDSSETSIGAAEPDVASAREALGTECSGADAEGTFVNGIGVTSPQTYNPPYCFKGQVYDVTNYDPNTGMSTGSGGGANASMSTLVKWADATPAVADCTSAWVGSDLFVSHDGTTGAGVTRWTYLGSQSGNGAVVRGACWVPSITWTSEMPTGRTYRVTASARTRSGSSADTRKVSVQTYTGGVPDRCSGKVFNDGDPCTSDTCDPATGVVSHTTIAGCCTSAGAGGGCH